MKKCCASNDMIVLLDVTIGRSISSKFTYLITIIMMILFAPLAIVWFIIALIRSKL